MNKPITLVREELIQNITKSINGAISGGLPVFAIKPILMDYLDQIKDLERQEYEADMVAYKASLENHSSSIDDEDDVFDSGFVIDGEPLEQNN